MDIIFDGWLAHYIIGISYKNSLLRIKRSYKVVYEEFENTEEILFFNCSGDREEDRTFLSYLKDCKIKRRKYGCNGY